MKYSNPEQDFQAIGIASFFATDEDKEVDWAVMFCTEPSGPVANDQPLSTQAQEIIDAVDTPAQPAAENLELARLQNQTAFALRVLGLPAGDGWNDG